MGKVAVVRPFMALRPLPELAERVSSPPYDVLSREEAEKLAKDNPYSFLHVERAEIDLEENIDPYNEAVYQKARENFMKMKEKKILIKDGKECYYIYRERMGDRVQTGLVALVSIDDYLNGVVKRHEHTLSEKEEDRVKHMDYCDAHTSPVFLAYKADERLKNLLKMWIERKTPVYDFTSEDGVSHSVWVIEDVEVMKEITEIFKEIPVLYIADGHHRAAASVALGLRRRESLKNYSGKEGFNYFLAVIVPHDELYIMPYNRVVRDLNGYSEEGFIQKVKEKFTLEEVGVTPFEPKEKHTFGMYLKGKWYKIKAKEGTFDSSDPIGCLDVSILQDNLLKPILGIENPRTDKRIEFVGGIRGTKELEEKVNKGMAVAFSLYPTSIEEIFAVADFGGIMPPKSTWFEPKLRSGIFVHEID